MAQKKQPARNDQPRPQPASRPAALKNNQSEPFVMTERWALIILICIACIVNIRTLSYEYVYDDAAFASSGNLIDIRGGIPAIPEIMTHAKNYCFDKSNTGSYRPLLPASFAVERSLGGFYPGVSHATNLILFSLMIIVLFRVLRRMFPDLSIYIPFFIMLIYELHPVHIEVIANVKGRDELMAVLFTGLAMLQSFKWLDNGQIKHAGLCTLYFLLAMLAKESPIGHAAVVPLTLYFFTKATPKQWLMSAAPYVAAVGIFIVLRIIFLDKAAANADVAITENFFVGATDLSHRVGTVFYIQLRYLGLLLFPHPLSFDYSYNQVPLVPFTDYRSLIGLGIFAAMAAYALINLKKKDIFSYAILFYFCSIFITSNLVMEIGAGMGERFLFIPSFGFCIALVFLAAKLFKANLQTMDHATAPKMSYLFGFLAFVYAAKDFTGNEDWRTNLTLFTAGAETTPNSWRSQHCLAVEYKKMAMAETNPAQQKVYADSAILHYKKSIAIYPLKADPWGDIGAIYFTMKQNDTALRYLQEAVRLNPELSSAMANLGTVYMTQGKNADAVIYYAKTVKTDPNNIIAQFNLGVCYYQIGKYDSAIANFKRAMIVNPAYNDHKAFQYTGIIYRQVGQVDSANKYDALARQFVK